MHEDAAKQLRRRLETIDVQLLETLPEYSALDDRTLQRIATLETAHGAVLRLLARPDADGDVA